MIYLLFIFFVILVGFLLYALLKAHKKLKPFKGVTDIQDLLKKSQIQVDALRRQGEGLQNEIQGKRTEIDRLNYQFNLVEDALEVQSFGFYEPKYGHLGDSPAFKNRLKQIRIDQKALVKNKQALFTPGNWTVNGSAAEGRKMVNKQVRLMLRAFNGECDAAIEKAKYNNVEKMEARIRKSKEAIDKLGESHGISIRPNYLNLKLQELYLVHEYREKVQEEKEEQRRIKEMMREEAKALKELERIQKSAAKDADSAQKAYERAQKEMMAANEEMRARMAEKVAALEAKLKEALEKKERALSMAQQTRSGHVYVISNIGSFGEGVFKIGMTRRLEPLDRVRELGDASVPFRFDVHAMIYSEDAPSLENHLHKVFDRRRVNKINLRREFFRVSLGEIEKEVHKTDSRIEFIQVPEAEEFRKTQAIDASGR